MIIPEIVYALIITVVFGSFFVLTKGTVKHHITTEDALNSTQCDEVCLIRLKCGEIYNNRLYSHEDFESGDTDLPSEQPEWDNYVTYRFFINTRPGEVYGLFDKKSDYALNIYADGKLVAETGNVSANSDDFVPSAAGPSGCFTASGKKTEIIVQQANFNHNLHYDNEIAFGPPSGINRYSTLLYLDRAVMFICLVTAALLNLGMYFFFAQKRRYLFFVLMCIAAAVNYATPLLTTFVFGDISWYISHKIEYCSKLLISFFAVAYADTVFEGYMKKALKIIFNSYCFLCIALTVALPSRIYTRLSTICAYILFALLCLLAVNVSASIKKNYSQTEAYKKLILFGAVTVLAFSMVELLGFSGKTFNAISTETGVVIFIFINSVALSLDFRDTGRMLDEAILREKELVQTNEAMENLNKMRSSFLSDLSHELKTPLTVISNISALAAYQLKNGITDSKTLSGLETVENEAVRLGKMVDQLKMKSAIRFENNGEKSQNLRSTLKFAADFCDPLCKRKNNKIVLRCEDGIKANISEDLAFHCIYNLIANATRHCENGVIELIGKSEAGRVIIQVVDHGDGMTEAEMAKAFERGYSGDSGSGIGLTLCREIAEDNGGFINLSNTPGGGLTVTIEFSEE